MKWLLIAGLVTLHIACASLPTTVTLANQLKLIQTPSEMVVPTGDGHLGDYQKLVKVAGQFGVTVVEAPPPDEGLLGAYYPQHHLIIISNEFAVDAKLAILSHEIAHVLQPSMPEYEGDVFAQAVSYLVCKRLGLDTWKLSAPYLRGDDAQLQIILTHYQRTIDACVELIYQSMKS